MRLRFPVTPELVTLIFVTCRELVRALGEGCGLNLLQYRALSLLAQRGSAAESDIARALRADESQLSRDLGKLAGRGLVRWETAGGSAKLWELTAEGGRVLDNADAVVAGTYDRLFHGLDPELNLRVSTGLLLSTESQGLIRVKDGAFFKELAYFESILLYEQGVTKPTYELGLNVAQFRVMYELLERGPLAKAALARSLALARSTATWACDGLMERGLVLGGPPGRRGQLVRLTAGGRDLAQRAVKLVDRRWCEIRVSSLEERACYQQIAEWFAKKNLR